MTPPDQPPWPFHQGLASRAAAMAVLAGLALAGNWLHVTLFFGVDYLFGSIATLLAAVWLGPLSAMAVAAAGGLYTLEMWGHPWALLIFVLEAGFVGLLRGRLGNLILTDLAFWLVLGAPMVFALYLGVMGMTLPQAGLIALKQPVNGIFNALLAHTLVLTLRSRLLPIAVTDLLFTLLFGVALLMGLALIAFQANMVQRFERQTIASVLGEKTTVIASRLQTQAASAGPGRALADDPPPGLEPPNGFALSRNGGRLLAGLRLPEWFDRAERRRLRPDLMVLLPPEGQDLPTMVRWRRALFAGSETVGAGSNSRKLLVTRPAGPSVERLVQANLIGHAVLAVIAVAGSLIALFLARSLAAPFERLRLRVHNLPARIERGDVTPIPSSALRELDALGTAFQEMTVSLNTTFRDLEDERRHLEATVRRRTRDLERFTEATAHHLQEPLRRVMVFAQRLEKRYGHEGQSENGDIRRVVEGARHMTEMLQGLQHYLALDARTLRGEEVNPAECLERAWEGLGQETLESGVELQRPGGRSPSVRGDAELIRQLFELLLANAVSYARPGIPARIAVTTALEGEQVRVTLCDNGRGVAPDYRDRVFRMFERMRPWEEPAGPGTGLALARKITELHGGTIWLADAVPGPGLCVHVSLPAAEPTTETPE